MDPLSEYDGRIFFNIEDLLDYTSELEQSNSLSGPENPLKLVLRSSDDLEASYLFKLAWEVQDLLVVVEEANIYLDPRSKFQSFSRLIAQGRHRNISLLLTSQRVPEMSPQYRAQKDSFFTFLQDFHLDLETLEKWGFDPQEVEDLEKYDCSGLPVNGRHYLCIGKDIGEYGISGTVQRQAQDEDEENLSEEPQREDDQGPELRVRESD